MENLYIFNPSVTRTQIQNAIYNRLNKVKAILTCIMFSVEYIKDAKKLSNSTLYHALWAVDEYLEELDGLFQQWEKRI